MLSPQPHALASRRQRERERERERELQEKEKKTGSRPRKLLSDMGANHTTEGASARNRPSHPSQFTKGNGMHDQPMN
jgi:hypothetical protein